MGHIVSHVACQCAGAAGQRSRDGGRLPRRRCANSTPQISAPDRAVWQRPGLAMPFARRATGFTGRFVRRQLIAQCQTQAGQSEPHQRWSQGRTVIAAATARKSHRLRPRAGRDSPVRPAAGPAACQTAPLKASAAQAGSKALCAMKRAPVNRPTRNTSIGRRVIPGRPRGLD